MNRALRRDLAAYASATIAEWALWVALLVDAFAARGSTAAGFVSLGLLVPAALAAPVAGAVADGRRPERALFTSYAVQSAGLALSSAAAAADAPLGLVLAPATAAVMAITFMRPCLSVVLPGHAVTAAQLTRSNLVMGTADSAAMLTGPLLAAALIAWRDPATALAGCALLTGAAATVSAVSALAPAPRRLPGARVRPAHALVSAASGFARVDGGPQMLASVAARYLVVGAVDLLVVVLAGDVLNLASWGPGVLSAMVGVGAVTGSLGARQLVGRPRLAPVIVASLLLTAAALALLGATTTLGIALVVLPFVGIGSMLGDVTARMLVQRAAPQESLASVFAVIEMLALACCALGTLLVQVVVAAAGPRAATLTVSVVVVVIVATSARRLGRVDDAADAPVVAIRLLRRLPIFAPLPPPALEAVARAAEPITVAAGTPIVHEGEAGDRYYAVADGEVDVTMAHRFVRTMGRAEGFGEIALLADVPRTATVTARSPCELLAVRRAPFLLAVTGHDASRRAAWSVAERFAGPLVRPAD